MSCNISKFNYCILQQETFKSPIFNFGDIDVSNDSFVYSVFKFSGGTKKEFPVNFIDDNTIYIEDIKMPLGDYQHELLWIRNGIKEVVFQGSLKVTDTGNNCGCTSNKLDIKVIHEDVVVNIAYSERIIERIVEKGPQGDSAYQVAVENGFVGTEAEWLESLKLHYSDLTEAEILELQQPAIEAAQTANTAADNANSATQNAISATNEANTATTNADNAANTANTSATNADYSADLATTAANNANDAATAANTAAENADNSAQSANEATSSANNATTNANVATVSANSAADNANTATQNAITATNEANTATTNANTATTNANASATNADYSADLATTAANNANDAATAANTAADFANSQRGWTPIHTFEADGAQRQVKKLSDYIGGTGNKPTANIGQYVVDSGYTSDKSLATNFKGAQGDNLIAEYIHSGNLEVVVSSINYTTNTLTSLNHGLINGDRVAFNITNDCNVLTQTPFSQMWAANSEGGGYFVANATQDTFQLTLSNGGAVMILNNRVGNDFTKWKIERASPDISIGFNNLNVKSLRCRILGGCHRTVRYILNNQGVYTGYKNTVVSATTIADRGALYGSIEFDIDIVNSCDLINVNLKLIGLNNSSTNLDYFTDNILIKPNRTSPITTIPSINLFLIKPFNGTLIQILKK